MKANVLIETEELTQEEWLRYRKQGIGGSDVASLIGISKWKSELELWLDKTNQLNEEQIKAAIFYVIKKKEFGGLIK